MGEEVSRECCTEGGDTEGGSYLAHEVGGQACPDPLDLVAPGPASGLGAGRLDEEPLGPRLMFEEELGLWGRRKRGAVMFEEELGRREGGADVRKGAGPVG